MYAATYTYDAAGNHTGDGQVVEDGNRIASDDHFDYAYDDEDNLVTRTGRASGEVTTFSYDYRNRQIDVTRTSAGGIILSEAHYTYDVFDREIARAGSIRDWRKHSGR